jgi:hypothetical protein
VSRPGLGNQKIGPTRRSTAAFPQIEMFASFRREKTNAIKDDGFEHRGYRDVERLRAAVMRDSFASIRRTASLT